MFHRLLSLIPRGALALMASLGVAAAAQAQNTIAITEYMNDTNGPAAQGEWVELYNYGTSPVNIGGWRLLDQDSDSVTLPSATIGPKEFLILARDKAAFEANWLKGVASPKVVQWPSGFALSDGGTDELILRNASNTLVWRIAYGDYPESNNGSSTWFTGTDFTVTDHGTKGNVISRNGTDAPTGTLGYEGQEYTTDPCAYSGNGDVGSPLRGHYPGAVNPPAPSTTWNVDLAAPGTPLSPGVRGIALADQALDRGDNSDQTGILPSVEVARGGSLRGVSGGLNADIYDWKTRNSQPRPTTLEFLRWARDSGSTLFITVNIRGLTEPDPDVPNHRRYTTTDTETLAQLAADWVRYTNRIVQTYSEGDTITDPRDAEILDSLTWNSSYVSPWGSADNYTTLPAVGEAPVPPVKYWEIGNEPLVSLANAYSVTNAFTFNGSNGNPTHQDYVNRYKALTTAMLAEDPTIKVGPCIVNGRPGANADILALLLQSDARIDFIAYHPYGSMGDYTLGSYPNAAGWQEGYLTGVYVEQARFLQEIKDLVATYRPGQAATMEYAATEVNVSDFRTNNQFQEGTMAHALGSVESVMSWGRLGLTAAHYWIWITANTILYSDWNRFPVTMAYEKMRDRLGDRLLDVYDAHDKVRMYLVRDSQTGEYQIWALNFSDSQDVTVTISMTNAGPAEHTTVKKQVLQALSGPTRLMSANMPPDLNGGIPRRDVDWSAEEVLTGADPASLPLTLPAATLTLVTVETVTPTAAEDWALYE